MMKRYKTYSFLVVATMGDAIRIHAMKKKEPDYKGTNLPKRMRVTNGGLSLIEAFSDVVPAPLSRR